MPLPSALGRAVQAVRIERGISQIQLPDTTGLMQSWISNVEHGWFNPAWSNVVRLAEGVGVSLSEPVLQAEHTSTSDTADSRSHADSDRLDS